jgi:hypothetical protein
MTETLELNGQEFEAPIRFAGGLWDITVRGDTEQALLDELSAMLLLREPEDGEAAWPPKLLYGCPCSIVPIEKTPAVMSEDGMTVVTPAVYDPRIHLNIRITKDALRRVVAEDDEESPLFPFNGQNSATVWAYIWSLGDSMSDQDRNNHEDGKVRGGITLIDPDTISTPVRVWA